MLLHLCDEVPAHGEEEDTVVEGKGGGGASRDGNPHAHDVTQVKMLRHERVDCTKQDAFSLGLLPHRTKCREQHSQTNLSMKRAMVMT